MIRFTRLLVLLSFVVILLSTCACVSATLAAAATTQESIVEDDTALHTNLDGTLATLERLGVTRVKVAVSWSCTRGSLKLRSCTPIAPAALSFHEPKGFDASDPAAYPSGNWAFYDDVVEHAQLYGIKVGFMLTGPAPLWATGPGMPKPTPQTLNCPCGQWKPSASAFEAFAQAVGRRYSGSFTPRGASVPLPRVSWWSIWNEPNFGPDLAPQATDDNTVEAGAVEYRGLVNAAWKGLAASGHTIASDTILSGELEPRGVDHPGNFSGLKPLRFLRALYCVNAGYQPLRGAAASARGCPTTAAGSRAFRAANPALFEASGVAVHPYEQGVPPDRPTFTIDGIIYYSKRPPFRSDPDYADFPEIPRLERTLDRLNAVYGSHARLPIWNTEYGWWTDPPDRSVGALPPQTVAYYMNWAEYLSYIQPRVASYDQYLLVDPANGQFAAGLELADGRPLATFDAFEVPLYMPVTQAGRASSLTVWGCVRPEPSTTLAAPLSPYFPLPAAGSQAGQVQIQFKPSAGGSFRPLRTMTITNPRGYFDVRQAFTRSGTVRLAWSSEPGSTVYSRTVTVTIR